MGQKLDWYIQPVLTDIDDVTLDERTQNIFLVKKGILWGIKSKTNELIIPIQYKSVQLSHDSKVIATFDGEKMAYFDGEGYTTTKEVGEMANRVTVEKWEYTNRQEQLNKGKLISVYHNGVHNYINKALDTILRLTDTKDPILYGNMYYVTTAISGKLTRIYDKKGNLIKSFDYKLSSLIEHKQGYYTNWYANSAKLFDKDFNVIEMLPCNGIKIHDSLDVMFIENNKKYVIKDLALNTLVQDSFTNLPFVAHKTDLVVIPHSDHVLVYSLSTKKTEKLPFSTANVDKNNPFYIVKENNKRGVYNFADKNYLLPTKFDFLSFTSNYYVATIGSKNSKEHEIFNSRGQSIFAGFYNSLTFTQNGFIVLDTTKAYVWYDGSGKLLKKFSSDEYLEYNRESNTFRINKKGFDSQSFFVTEYFSQPTPKPYEALGERLNSFAKTDVPIFIMMNNGKYGIIDINGKVVLEPTFTKIIKNYTDKWLVEYNGKMGVLNLPKIPLKS